MFQKIKREYSHKLTTAPPPTPQHTHTHTHTPQCGFKSWDFFRFAARKWATKVSPSRQQYKQSTATDQRSSAKGQLRRELSLIEQLGSEPLRHSLQGTSRTALHLDSSSQWTAAHDCLLDTRGRQTADGPADWTSQLSCWHCCSSLGDFRVQTSDRSLVAVTRGQGRRPCDMQCFLFDSSNCRTVWNLLAFTTSTVYCKNSYNSNHFSLLKIQLLFRDIHLFCSVFA